MKERESDPEMPVDPSDSGISTKERRVSRMFFAILLLMYTVASVETMFASRSGAHFIFMGAEIPLSMLTAAWVGGVSIGTIRSTSLSTNFCNAEAIVFTSPAASW